MKKILIAGGTGFIGTKLISFFEKKNYEIILLSRKDDRNSKILKIAMNEKNSSEILEQINGASALINLSGNPVMGSKWTNEYKAEIIDSRINTTNYLANLILQSNNKNLVFISSSGIGYYGDRQDSVLTESSFPGDDFLAKVCIDWENAAKKAESKCRLVIARIGVVLDKNEGALPKMALPFKFFLGGALGNGKQQMSWIHIDDLVGLFDFFIENTKIKGPVNIVANDPKTMKQFAKELAHTLHRPSLFPVPAFVLRIILGEAAAVVLNSQKVIPQVSINNGYQYKFPKLDLAFKDIYN